MSLKDEMQNAKLCGKTFIKPHVFNEMQKTASKIADILLRGSTAVTYGYDDMKVILKIVYGMLDEHLQDGKPDEEEKCQNE